MVCSLKTVVKVSLLSQFFKLNPLHVFTNEKRLELQILTFIRCYSILYLKCGFYFISFYFSQKNML